MNILYILQQSIYGNDGKWKTADSNIQMMLGIFRELLEKTNWKFHVLIAPIDDFSDIKSYSELIDDDRVDFIPYHFPIDAFLNRQNFNVSDFDDVFKLRLPKIDIVWNNIIELSRNIRTYLDYKNMKNVKLISCCYWMDCPEIGEEKVDKRISYDWRQFDGYECSDLCVFTCESTRDAFIENACMKFNESYINKIEAKSTVWDFGFSTKEMDSYKVPKGLTKKTVMFLNRMSGINYTHHIEFIEAVNRLAEKRNDFQVVFANPSGKVPWKWLKENVKNLLVIKEDVLTREEYVRLLWSGHISVHLYLNERYGGCSSREALYCGNMIIAPNVFEYRRILGEGYPFYCDNDFKDLDIVIGEALDCKNYDKNVGNIKKRNNDSSFENVSDDVIEEIGRIL